MVVKSERRYVYCTPVSIPQFSFMFLRNESDSVTGM